MEIARRRIERAFVAAEPVLVTDLVIAEVFHALRHHYRVPAAEALSRLRDLLGSGVVRLDPAAAAEAVGPQGRGQAGIVDRLIVARHRSLGATTTTFDRTQARLEAAPSCALDRGRRSGIRSTGDEETSRMPPAWPPALTDGAEPPAVGDAEVAQVDRRRFLGRAAATAALGALGLAGCGVASRRGARPPNVLIVLADDLGWGDLSCYGRTDYRTPVLDALATEGVRLTHAYAASCVCTPTRAALLTGRYPQRLGSGLARPIVFRRYPGDGTSAVGLPPSHPTLASLLRGRGYRTALVGKWHLGYPPRFSPLQSGFAEFFGITSGGVDYFTHRDGGGHPDLIENDVPVERAGYITDLLAERAADVVASAARQRQPFYLGLHFTAVHWPWMGPRDAHRAGLADLRDHGGGSTAVFAEMVQSLDAGVGRVLAALDRHGLTRDTLVIFTSDNGGERFSHHAPLSGQKEDLLEGGIRVPAIARWPAAIPAGAVSPQVVITMDWTATVLSATGTAADPRHPLDGHDLLPELSGVRPQRSRTLHWRHRRADAPQIQEAMLEGHLKYLVRDDREALFDLARDPGEQSDLARVRPADVMRMRVAHDSWFAQMPP
jgi:arylsulfatase A-like enzyme